MKVILEFEHENGDVRLIEVGYYRKYEIQFKPHNFSDINYNTIASWYSNKCKIAHIKYFHKVCKTLKQGVKIEAKQKNNRS